MLKCLSCLLVLLVVLAVSGTAFGITYYVDRVEGNDASTGTSTSAAWQTLARASAQSYAPGDQILLKRGCVWQEPAFFPTSSGAAGAPIVLADYGAGALPKIIGNGGSLTDSAVILRNISYWTVRNLELTQVGPQPPTPPGENPDYADQWLKPVFEIRGLYDGTVAHIRVENCLVHDGGWNGIYIMGGYYQDGTGVSGYADDIVVDGVESYNNGKAGIEASCRYTKTIIYFTTNVQVINTTAHDNGGDGVVMGPAGSSLIDNCVAYHNGLTVNARVGLWFWDAGNCVIQNSESYGNVVPPEFVGQSSARDGSGFDLDLGTLDCVIQYCYSHDNMGEGYLLMEWPIGYGYSRGYTDRITLRYSISERDAYDHGGCIEVYGGVANTYIYNNTVYYIPERSAGANVAEGEGGCLTTDKWGKSGVPAIQVYNNIFVADKSQSQNPNAVSFLVRHEAGTITANNNLYWTIGTTPLFDVSGKTGNFVWWQGKGYDAQGLNANPLFTGAFGGGDVAYTLQSGSPARNAGRMVTDWSGSMGVRDYFGNPNLVGSAYDIGCAEYQGGGGGDTEPPTAPTNLSATAVSSSQIYLSWTASTDNVGVTGYQIFRDDQQVGTSATTSYVDTGLTASTTYSYYVKAYDAANNVSPQSNTAQATTLPGGGGSTVMHIGDFYTCDAAGVPTSNFTSSNDPNWKVKVVDADGNPVADVSVATSLYRPNGNLFNTQTATTDAAGFVTFSQNLVKNSGNGTWTITADSLTKSGWTRDLGADVRTSVTFQYQG